MNLLFFTLSFSTLLDTSSPTTSIAMEINCKSLVWQNRELCATNESKRKSIQYGSWVPFGFDENGNAVNYVQLLSYEKLNKNSFRLKSKFTSINDKQIEGKLDVNCQNKDYYIRPIGKMSQRGTWASIPKGSGIEILSRYLCKRTAARDEWGYTERTSYLWDYLSPQSNPSEISGEWIQHSDGLGWYNTEVREAENSVIYAYYSKSKSNNQYVWVNNSCIDNLSSIFYRPSNSVDGEWLSPKRGRPGGASEMIRKSYCK
tara:strand:- start:1734 stop:2510 length:777 start_codon:yes stop_codon:yes gene_type:complete